MSRPLAWLFAAVILTVAAAFTIWSVLHIPLD